MAVLVKKTFVHQGDGCFEMRRCKHPDNWLCGSRFVSELQKLFSLPDEVKSVDVTLHDRPGRERVSFRVKMVDLTGCGLFPALVRPGIEWEYNVFDQLLKPLTGRTVHMAVEYEET